jgi:hypothetical protein
MSDWFFMLGEPLSASEREQVLLYLRGLGIDDEVGVESVPDWQNAGRAISNPEWDRRWWVAEQREKDRLYEVAKADLGEREVLQSLSRTLESTEAVLGAAAVQAARRGCSDAALIRVAAGAASQTLHLAALARLAGEQEGHPFLIKAALFAGGHWPLGIVNGRFCVF